MKERVLILLIFCSTTSYSENNTQVDGNKIGEPSLISASGWGEQDRLISLGNGKAAWTYIVDPTLKANGNFRNPEQSFLGNDCI